MIRIISSKSSSKMLKGWKSRRKVYRRRWMNKVGTRKIEGSGLIRKDSRLKERNRNFCRNSKRSKGRLIMRSS